MKKVSMFKMLKSISEIMDLVSNSVVSHHKKVTYITYKIAKEMDLAREDLKNLIMAAIIHDIGVFYIEDVNLHDFTFDDEENFHAQIGYYLLAESQTLNEISLFIKYHHHDWDKYTIGTPPIYNILHLADEIAFLTEEYDIYNEKDKISKIIEQNSGTSFWPEPVQAFQRLINKEYFCLDLKSTSAIDRELEKITSLFEKNATLDNILEVSKIISYIVDFRSSFTATHSIGVASVAKELARLMNFALEEQLIMELAGYLHDIGKLVVPPEILNKNGKLNPTEWRIMRSHTYYTYQVLEHIDELPQLKRWAAYHHETLDGKGYPFQIQSNELSKGARIMAVADIFTAITEDRPYRVGMKKKKVKKVFTDLVENEKVDKNIVDTLFAYYKKINNQRKMVQLKGQKYYQNFRQQVLAKIS